MTIEELREKVTVLNRIIQETTLDAWGIIETSESRKIEEDERLELQREAFEAGRNSGYEECLNEKDRTYPHTFEEYLKSLEND